ncbi:MAG: HipA domain-containing protein [Alphaproteobacteria bacterium]|nr:HipA domain-containing protein [Alphaproteobacteria bacterium]
MHAVGKPLRRSKLSIGVQYGVPFCTPIDKVLAEIVRHRFAEPVAALRELFGRLVFNILCGNTDDHARNHAAFWDGKELRLTPAYDLCPQSRSGQIASQAMLIAGDARFSQLTHGLKAAGHFLLSTEAATGLIAKQVETIKAEWAATRDAADLSQTVRALFWGRQFLNPYAFEGVGAEVGRPAS